MIKTILRRTGKVLLWIVGILLLLVVLLAIAIQLDPVQQWLTGKVETIAAEQLGTEVSIGRIGLDIPTNAYVKDVWVDNPDGERILTLAYLEVGMNMWGLLKKQISISKVQVSGLKARVITTDSTSNIQFLLDKFMLVDTSAAQEDPAITTTDTTAAAAWGIEVSNLSLMLDSIDVVYQDDPTALALALDLGVLTGKTGRMDLLAGRFGIDRLQLEDTDIAVKLGVTETDTTAAPAALDYLVQLGRLGIRRTSLTLAMDSLDLETYIESTDLEDAELKLAELIDFSAGTFALTDSRFKVDIPAPPIPQADAVDFNHLELTGVNTELTDIRYVGDSLHLRLRQLAARERSGLEVTRTEGVVDYSPRFIGLENFLLRTTDSELNSKSLAVVLDLTEGVNLEEIAINADLNGYVGLRDVGRLAPDLRKNDIVGGNLGKRLEFLVDARGNGRRVNITRIRVDGPGMHLIASRGRVDYPFDTDRLAAVLNLDELEVRPGPILPLLPDTLLPADIVWPDRIVANGRFDYANDGIDLTLYALEQRGAGQGVLNSRVQVGGRFVGLTSYPNSRVDMILDTLLATKKTLLAYLPPSALPEGYKLPEFVRGSGSVKGPMERLVVDLNLSLPGESTTASINGTIVNALEPDKLNLDINVSNLRVAALDVNAILPDSLLPAYLKLPDLQITNAQISGSLDDLTFNLPLTTSNGKWDIKGRYNPNDLNVDLAIQDLDLAELFTGSYADTIRTLDLKPLSITATAKGKLEPTMQLAIQLNVNEQGRGELVDLSGTVDDQTYTAEFAFKNEDLLGNGNAFYTVGPDSVASVKAVFNLDRIDMQRWDLTEVPVMVEMKLRAESVGLDPYNLEGRVEIDDFIIRTDESSSFVDSMVVLASMHDSNNEVTVRSDLLDADLNGVFDPLAVGPELSRFIRGYWEEQVDQPDPMESGRNLNFNLNLKRTRPLTSGLIAGLEELSPTTINFTYQDANPGLLLEVRLPRLKYTSIEIDSLVMDAAGDTTLLTYEANIKDVNFSDALVLGRSRFSGKNEDGQLRAEFRVWNKTDSLRHHLNLLLDPETDTIRVALAENQRINYQEWSVPPTNQILLAGPTLLINDFALTYQDQALRAETTEPNNVAVSFENFDLTTISRLLNSEEELVGGILNGDAAINDIMTSPVISSEVRVDSLAVFETLMGKLEAEVTTENEQVYRVDLGLTEAGNQVQIDGTYALSGDLDLRANLQKFQLESLEAFSVGYLQRTEGYLTGDIQIGGSTTAPRLNGDLRFVEAKLGISLLGGQFAIGENPIRFNGPNISMDGFALIDSLGNRATFDGNVVLNSVTDVDFDLTADANCFLALNSTADDNPDYYGKLFADAQVRITGDLTLPVVTVVARACEGSDITYVYTAPEAGLQTADGTMRFIQKFEWQNVLRRGTRPDSVKIEQSGFDLTLDLAVTPDVQVTVVVDPISGQNFVGRADGDLTLNIFPDGRQEMVGRVELTEGTYDFILQGLRREFVVVEGSSVNFTGEVINPQLDLEIRHAVKTQPLPLVQRLNESADVTGLRRDQTFYVVINLKGDLQASNLTTDVTYPEDVYGNVGYQSISAALAQLRQDQSRITSTAFSLLAFQSFNIPIVDQGTGGGNLVGTTINNALSGYLNNLANKYIGFVELDFGLDSYENAQGEQNTNLRVSLRKTLFDDRVVISVDGVTNSDGDDAGNGQSYLDNLTLEYLIDEKGQFRAKIFNDRDRDALVGGNVIRFGGRLVFAKDFERINWFGNDNKKKNDGK